MVSYSRTPFVFSRASRPVRPLGNAEMVRATPRSALAPQSDPGTIVLALTRAMVRLPGALRDAGLSARMLLQVHDELLFEVPEGEMERTVPVVRAVMENVATLRVPLSVEVGQGHSWAEAH